MRKQIRYTRGLANKILTRLADGESLKAICRDEGMPAFQSVRRWVIDNKDGFAEKYARARDLGLDVMADEILEIADQQIVGERKKTRSDGTTETTTGDIVERSKLKVDARKWYLSKLAPKRYGEQMRHELTGQDGGPIVVFRDLTGRKPPSE